MIFSFISLCISFYNLPLNYYKKFEKQFEGFEDYLTNELIEGVLDVDIILEQDKLNEELFNRLDGIDLVDKYEAYQYLSSQWKIIYNDIEMIQNDGFDVINQVDPNIVVKKKNNKGEIPEVQEGWKGHILPFELVQKEFFKQEVNLLEDKENELLDISADYQEILESLDQEEKESALLNDANDAFVSKEVTDYVKEILGEVETEEINYLNDYLELSKKSEKEEFENKHKDLSWDQFEKTKTGSYKVASIRSYIIKLQMEFEFDEDSLESKMIKVNTMIDRERLLKREIKELKEQLHIDTKEMIESMDEDQSLYILKEKWITPLINNLFNMPQQAVKKLVSEIDNIHKKYSETLSEIDDNITTSSKVLIELMDDLEANEVDSAALNELIVLLSGGQNE